MPGHLAEGLMQNGECFPLRLMFFLVYQVNEFFAEALVSTRNLKDLSVAFFGQSFFRKRPFHLCCCFVLNLLTLFRILSFFKPRLVRLANLINLHVNFSEGPELGLTYVHFLLRRLLRPTLFCEWKDKKAGNKNCCNGLQTRYLHHIPPCRKGFPFLCRKTHAKMSRQA